MEDNKNFKLDDNALDAVTGGASDTVYLEEHNLPGGWYVTCSKCPIAFPASEGSCPVCGGTEVMLGINGDVHVYDPSMFYR